MGYFTPRTAMNSYTYYVHNLQFEIDEDGGYKTLYAYLTVHATKYLYGSDIDGRRGVYQTERQIEVDEILDEAGHSYTANDKILEELQRIIDEKGAKLE